MINKKCVICAIQNTYSRTRDMKYFCYDQHNYSNKKAKVLKKRGRKRLTAEEKIMSLELRKEKQKTYNKFYYKNFVLSKNRSSRLEFQAKKSTQKVL